MKDEIRAEIALARFKLISPVLAEPGRVQNEYFRSQTSHEHDLPHYGRRRIKVSTFKLWLRQYARMARSHAWVKRGTEYIERRPMNWGKNLTLLGAMRVTGWIVLSTMLASTNKEIFVEWLRTKLLPQLNSGDVLVLDNLAAHHDPRVVSLCKSHGVRVLYLPPYSPDFNPIESGWALQKQYWE